MPAPALLRASAAAQICVVSRRGDDAEAETVEPADGGIDGGF